MRTTFLPPLASGAAIHDKRLPPGRPGGSGYRCHLPRAQERHSQQALRGCACRTKPCHSFQTVAELLRWGYERNWGERRLGEQEEYLRQFIVYPYSFDLAKEWAEIHAEAKRSGKPIGSADAWIAATALVLDVPLVSNNRKDFQNVSGLKLISFA